MNFTPEQLKMVTEFMELKIIFTISNGNTSSGLVSLGYDKYKTILKICEKSGLEITNIEVY